MKKIHSYHLEVFIHPITLKFSDITIEHEYREVAFQPRKLIPQILLVLIMTISIWLISPFPLDNIISKLIYITTIFLSTWGVSYILERRQRFAFLKQKKDELRKAHFTNALTKLSQKYDF